MNVYSLNLLSAACEEYLQSDRKSMTLTYSATSRTEQLLHPTELHGELATAIIIIIVIHQNKPPSRSASLVITVVRHVGEKLQFNCP